MREDKQLSKKLIGRTITKVKWLSPDESYKIFGWDFQPCEIHLDDGTILTPSADDEGNNAGALFTNLKGHETIGVQRGYVSEQLIKEQNKKMEEKLKSMGRI